MDSRRIDSARLEASYDLTVGTEAHYALAWVYIGEHTHADVCFLQALLVICLLSFAWQLHVQVTFQRPCIFLGDSECIIVIDVRKYSCLKALLYLSEVLLGK